MVVEEDSAYCVRRLRDSIEKFTAYRHYHIWIQIAHCNKNYSRIKQMEVLFVSRWRWL